MKRTFAALLLAACLLTGCGGEAPGAQARSEYIFAMDTVMELTVYGDEELLADATQLIQDLDAKLSVTGENSEIYAVNRSGTGALSPDAAQLLQDALALCARTGGALDLSIYPVVRAWGFTTGEYRVPDREELDALLENVDYTRIRFHEEDSTVDLDAGMEIDLGSVAKGYTSSRVISLFRESGVTSAMINLGGNVHLLGSKPDGSPWRVAVRDPLNEEEYLCVLSVSDKAVITSGGYERFFEQDGETYWHIIDPATGAPAASGLISVTVVGEDGLVCDGLSTALFVMGLDAAAQLWRESSDFEAVFVTDEGEIYVTEGLEHSIESAGDYRGREMAVIRRG